ncbi:hypothetical protein AT746_17330 [Lacimicrobium alkaliphilum]|uniref:Flagellar L-ring protein n=2 Tax=Lacimicrobium alkaliphilum TaxID=1526571 RepID=A0A0U2QQ72_9ALTE|nr:hypothetical protein AT746_17330 [Lacimicrobium alkaliphilum]
MTCLVVASCKSIQYPNTDSAKATEISSKKQLSNLEKIKNRNHPDYSPIHIRNTESMQVYPGSLFNPDSYNGVLHKKENYNIGDMIKVTLMERTEAYKTQNLANEKSDQMDIRPLEINAGSLNVRRGDVSMSHKQDSKFDSKSNSKQENYLKGEINVFVNEILHNGNLLVSGEKWIKLNEGDEYIRVSGEIRIADISPDNIIASTNIGNPLIEYSGKGRLMDNQDRGLISKILSFFE